MRATIIRHAIILTKAHRASVSMTAMGCILAKYSHVYAIMMQYSVHILPGGKFWNRNTSHPLILPSPHFQWIAMAYRSVAKPLSSKGTSTFEQNNKPQPVPLLPKSLKAKLRDAIQE